MAYSKVERKIWNDERFRSWNRDPRDAWQYLLTTPHQDGPAARLGCVILDPLYAAADLSAPDDPWTRERVEAQLRFFHEGGRIVWDPATRLVLLCNYFDHNRPENPNVAKGIAAAVAEIPFSATILGGLALAVQLFLPEKFTAGKAAGEPCGEAILSAINTRLEKARLNGSETVTPTVPKPLPLGLGNPEPEPEPEPLRNTGANAPDAGRRVAAPPIVENPPAANGGDPADAELRATIAPAVRKHLWIDGRPPNRRWSEGNEITAARQILERERGRTSLDELVGAIEVARMVLSFEATEPLTLKIFNDKERGPQQLLDCVDYWRAVQLQKRAQQTMRRLGDREASGG